MLKVDTSNPVNHSDRYQAMFAGELACPSILGSNHVLCLILMAARHGEPYQVREHVSTGRLVICVWMCVHVCLQYGSALMGLE